MTFSSDDGKTTGSKAKKHDLRCPTCRQTTSLSLVANRVNVDEGGIVHLLIPKQVSSCNHAFQVFVDKNLKIRGYDRIDQVYETGGAMVDDPGDEGDVLLKDNQVMDAGGGGRKALPRIGEEARQGLGEIILGFTAKVPEVVAIACFDYEGNVIASAMNEDMDLEDISMMAAAMMTRSDDLRKTLKLDSLEDFTISSGQCKVLIKKAGDLLVLVYHDKQVKQGLMHLALENLVNSITRG